MLEIALRNKVDEALTAAFGINWPDNNQVLTEAYQRSCVADAKRTIQGKESQSPTARLLLNSILDSGALCLAETPTISGARS